MVKAIIELHLKIINLGPSSSEKMHFSSLLIFPSRLCGTFGVELAGIRDESKLTLRFSKKQLEWSNFKIFFALF